MTGHPPQPQHFRMTLRDWKLGIFAALALAFITSLPQLYLCYERGSNWNGGYAYLDSDEFVYSAYLNALIDGRPRRSDPYTRKDGTEFETFFSVQFVPAYVLAISARVLHLSASTMFIVLVPVATTTAALVIFWLLAELTGNMRLAAIGVVGVLCFGTLAAYTPTELFLGNGKGYDILPFLRRYSPALAFPIFFAMCLFVWRALTKRTSWAVLAGVSFVILVYSYFFLWTAAAAWLFTILLLWFIHRPEDRPKTCRVFGIIIAIGSAALLFYAWLLMHRLSAIDRAEVLEMARFPDLLRAPEGYGLFILGALGYQAIKGTVSWRQPRILFTASFAIAPVIVFNQQVLTGYSLQPFHYEEFIANYCVVLAAFLAFGIAWPRMPQRILIFLLVGSLGIGMLLGVAAARTNIRVSANADRARALFLTLKEEDQSGTVFSSDWTLMQALVTTSANPPLWAQHSYIFSNIDLAGQKNRFYQYLYYSGVDRKHLALALGNDFTTRAEVFGSERANQAKSAAHRPITSEEIDNAVREYQEFVNSFDSNRASNPILSYAVVSPDDNLSNLDRWYERVPRERVGDLTLYRLKLRL